MTSTNRKSKFFTLENTDINQNNENKKEAAPYTTQLHSIYKQRSQLLGQLYHQKKRHLNVVSIWQLRKGDPKPRQIMGVVLKKMTKFLSFIKEREDPMFDDFIECETDVSWSPQDQMFIEDETGQIEVDPESTFKNSLQLDLKTHSFVTGSFVLVTGRLEHNYKFFVDEISILHDTKNLNSHKQSQQIEQQESDCSSKLLCLSGLGLTKSSLNQKSYHNLRNFFLFNQSKILKETDTLLVFGGIFGQLKDLNIKQYGNYWFQQNYDEKIKDIEKTSVLFEQLIEGLSDNPDFGQKQILIQPSITDPISQEIPQDKFSSILFPIIEQNLDQEFIHNPQKLYHQGKEVLIIDGYIVENYSKYSNKNFLESLKMMIYFGHIAPNAPNTLEIKHDVEQELILERLPDYIITSTEEEFGFHEIKDNQGEIITTLILVPRFETHKKVFLIDIEKKDYRSIGF